MTERRKRTPADRAQDAYDRAGRQLDKAQNRRNKAHAEYEAAKADVDRLLARRAYLAQDPDLPVQGA